MVERKSVQGRNIVEVMMNSFSKEERDFWDKAQQLTKEEYRNITAIENEDQAKRKMDLSRLIFFFEGKTDDVPVFIKKDGVIIGMTVYSKEDYFNQFLKK